VTFKDFYRLLVTTWAFPALFGNDVRAGVKYDLARDLQIPFHHILQERVFSVSRFADPLKSCSQFGDALLELCEARSKR